MADTYDGLVSPSPLAGEGLGRGDDPRLRQKLLRKRARSMRSAPTEAEHRLWSILRAKRLSSHKFKRQLPIDSYIVDFACLRHRLVVEADGGQYGGAADVARDRYLEAQGFRVLRFWNNDIFNNEEGVLTVILEALSAPLPNPSPAEGRGASVERHHA